MTVLYLDPIATPYLQLYKISNSNARSSQSARTVLSPVVKKGIRGTFLPDTGLDKHIGKLRHEWENLDLRE